LEERRLLATFTVTSTADDGSTGTLRSVIAEANADSGASTIDFDATVFSTPQTIALSGIPLELSNTTGTETITGPAAGVTVSAGGKSRVFLVDKLVTASISGLTFSGGKVSGGGVAGFGGGLLNDGTVSLTDCTVSSNSAYNGGGLFNDGSANLTDCTVSGNSAGYDGGGLDNAGTMTLTDCTVSHNLAFGGESYGGGLFNYGTANLTNCTVSSNTAGGFDIGGGGGLANDRGTMTLTDCTVSGNSVVYNESGGGLDNVVGTANLTGCTISDNTSEGAGGGLVNWGTANLIACTVSGNKYDGLSNLGTANLTNCTLSGNSGGNGGGLENAGKANLTNCTLSGNSATYGGGLSNYGTANLTSCTLSGNSATDGGALFNHATMNLTACTVSGNWTPNVGGGLDNSGTANLTDTIVAGNTLPNSLIANDIGGTSTVSGSYNLIGIGGSGGLQNGVNGNIVLGDLSTLGLAPLGNYGGPTQTMALLPVSEAIGNGTPVSGVTTDQRGFPLDSPNPDIGAFQKTQSGLVVNTPIDGTGSPSGDLSLRQAVNLANMLDVAETITFGSTVFATAQTITLTQGQLELSDTGGTETITGPAAGVTVSGGGTSRVFQVDGSVTASISGLTISGGSASLDGGGLDNKGTATLNDCTISGNSAKNNGGGLGDDGTATLTDCTISGNSANGGGGLVIGGMASLTGCTISGNYASVNGGGLYNKGTATLQNTIVAGNTGSGSSASDIKGSVAGSSSYNLIGTGGPGGLTNGTENNIVLTSLAGLGLAPLGAYGGPTETMALLPGSAAIGAGAAVSGLTTDQRGAPRPTSGAVDIGAFQDQGYTVAVASGSPQSTLVSQAFSSPLAALLTENFTSAPLPGVTIGFSAPSSGASATLSASSAVTSASGPASITATANATAGNYAVTAAATGVTSSASFNLTNQIRPSFSGLTGQTVTYGSTVTFTGTLAAGPQVPVGQEVAVTVAGVTRDAQIASNGSFSTQFTRSNVVLNASSTAYSVTYDYATDGVFLAADGSSQLTVNPAALTITAVANTKVYDGTTSATAVPTITSGSLATGDTADFTETYSTRNVGTGLTLTPSGKVDDGNGGHNYNYTFVPESTGVITPAALTITATSDTKVYDGTTTSSKTPTHGTLYDGDTVTGLTQAFTSKNVLGANGSTLSVTSYTVNDGDGGNDYTVTTQNAAGSITPAALTISATSDTKVYDGTTTSSKTPTHGTLYDGDTVTGPTQAFTSKNVLGANGSTLTVTSYTVNDGDGGNDYKVTTRSVAGSITPAALTITATSDSKVYDGTTSSSQTPTHGMLYDGDTVTGLTQAFTSENVLGTGGSTLTITGYTVNDGFGGNDYTVTTQEASGTITPAAASQLFIAQEPSSPTVAGLAFSPQPIVTEEDPFGNVITSDNSSTVTAARGSLGTATLMGSNLTVRLVSGVATFSGLSYNKAEKMDISFTSNAEGVSSVTSNSIVVTPETTATQLAFGQGPTDTSAGAAISPPVTVLVEDSFNNVVTTDSSQVTLTLSTGTFEGGLNTATVTAAMGVATFNDLKIDVKGSYTLSATDDMLMGSVASKSFTVNPAAADHFAVTTTFANSDVAGTAGEVTVTAMDKDGNVLSSGPNEYLGTVDLSSTDNQVAGLPATYPFTAGDAGSHIFSSVALKTAGSSQTITAIDAVNSAIKGTSNGVPVVAAPATQLAVTRRPGGVIAGAKFALTVDAEDPYNNVDKSFGNQVTVGLESGSSGSLSGTVMVTAINGEATFNDLVDTTSGPISVGATSGNLTVGSSGGFSSTVSPATPSQVVFGQQPTDSTAGVAMATPVTVKVEDQYRNLVDSDTSTVTLTLDHGTFAGGASTATAAASGGVASFSGLTIDLRGSYTLSATDGMLAGSGASDSFTVSPGVASELLLSRPPSSTATAGQPFGTQPAVYVADRFGNMETGDNSTVVTAAVGSGTGSLQGTTATVVGGMATFTNLADDTAGTITLKFTSGSLTPATTTAINVLPPPATVERVTIDKIKTGKKKTTEVIELQFNQALNTGDAKNLRSYSLVTVPKSKKKSTTVVLAKASYNSTTFTVTLTTRKALVLSPPLKLTVKAASLLDVLGRPVDGGANIVATLSKSGATVTSAVPLVRASGLSARALDAVLGAGFRPGVVKRWS